MEDIIQRRTSRPWLAVFAVLYFMASVIVEMVFIILKACGAIQWSWAAVMLPFIILGGIFLILVTFLVVCAILITNEYNKMEEDSDIRAGADKK